MWGKVDLASNSASHPVLQTVNAQPIPTSAPQLIDLNGAGGQQVKLQLSRFGRGSYTIETSPDLLGRRGISFSINGGSGLAGEWRRVVLLAEVGGRADVRGAGETAPCTAFFEARLGTGPDALYASQSAVWRTTMPEVVVGKVLSVDVQFGSNGMATAWVPLDIKLSGNTSNFDAEEGSVMFDVNAWVRLSQNFVLIESPTIEDSFYKAVGPVLPPGYSAGDRVPHTRHADGSMLVDSAVMWKDQIHAWTTESRFDCKALGYGTNSTYQWQRGGDGEVYIGAGVGDVSAQPYKDILLKLQLSPSDATSDPDLISWLENNPKTTTLNVTVSDPVNGATGTAQYGVKWHLPAENMVEDESKRELDTDIKILTPDEFRDGDFVLEGGTLDCAWWYRKEYWLADRDLDDYVGPFVGEIISNIPKLPLALVLMKCAGISLSLPDHELPRLTSCPNNLTTWNEAQLLTTKGKRACIPPPPAGDPPFQWDECEMYYPLVSVHYNDHFFSYDACDKNGYLGRRGKWERRPSDTSPKYAGEYRKKTQIGGGGP